jgi:hypothetical protein
VNRAHLVELQRAALAEFGLVPPATFDVATLPEDGESWDTWARLGCMPPLPPEPKIQDYLDAFAACDAEIERRRDLVEHARALIRSERSDHEYADLLREARDLSASLAHRRETLASKRRCLEAKQAVRNKTPIAVIRCDRGCRLALIYLWSGNDEPFDETVLAIGRQQRGHLEAAWLADSKPRASYSAALRLTCPHGHGRLPTAGTDWLDRRHRAKHRISTIPGASWKAGNSRRSKLEEPE